MSEDWIQNKKLTDEKITSKILTNNEKAEGVYIDDHQAGSLKVESMRDISEHLSSRLVAIGGGEPHGWQDDPADHLSAGRRRDKYHKESQKIIALKRMDGVTRTDLSGESSKIDRALRKEKNYRDSEGRNIREFYSQNTRKCS